MQPDRAAWTAVLLLVVGWGGCGRAPTPDDLHRSIVDRDVVRVRTLLEGGISPTATTSAGETAVKAAVLAVTGPVRDPEFRSRKWEADSPPLLILQEVMRSVRNSTHHPFDARGKLTVAMREGPSNPETGMTFLTSVHFEAASRQYELAMAGWETTFVAVDRPDGWNPVLRPGSTYKVVGAEKDGLVEVYTIELEGEPAGKNAFRYPLMNYLPSTFEQLRANSWLGERP